MFHHSPSNPQHKRSLAKQNKCRKSDDPDHIKKLAIERARQQKCLGQPMHNVERIIELYGEENIEIYQKAYNESHRDPNNSKKKSKGTYSKVLTEFGNETTPKRKSPEEEKESLDILKIVCEEENKENEPSFSSKRQKSNPHPETEDRGNFSATFFEQFPPLELNFQLQMKPTPVEPRLQPQIGHETFETIVKSKNSPKKTLPLGNTIPDREDHLIFRDYRKY